jgi:alpha-glucosidase
MYPLLAEIREIVDNYPEKYIVGETFMSTPEKAAQYVGKNHLHAAFNFKFQECKWNAGCFFNVMQRWQQVLGEENWPNYVLNNHDVCRSATRYGRGEDDERLKVAATMLLTLQGTPFLYYGEEIGMRDIPISKQEIQDPVGKHYWPFFKGRDGCRAPMQWNQSTFSGFSTTTPWLKLHQNYSGRNVAIQQDDPNSLLNFYIQLIKIRKSYLALQNGMFISLTYNPQTLLGYLRQNSEQTILVGLNFNRKTNKLVLSGSLLRSGWELLISNKRAEIGKMEKGYLALEPEEALVMIQKE